MPLVREIPRLHNVALSPTKFVNLKPIADYGETTRVRFLNMFMLLFIENYQVRTRDKTHVCNMKPSCSEYARIAFLRYGFVPASILSFERIKMCGNRESVWPQENKP